MGLQPRYEDRKGAREKARQTKKTMVGRARWFGWTVIGENRDRLHVSENTELSMDRPAIKGFQGTHPRAPDDPTAAVLRRSAGGAFSWWTSQSPAEKQATIARLLAENEALLAKMKAAKEKKKESPSV